MSEKEIKEEVVLSSKQEGIVSLFSGIYGLILGILLSVNAFFVFSSNTRHAFILCLFFACAMQVLIVLGFWLTFAKLKKHRFEGKTINLISIGVLINFAAGFLTCFYLIGYQVYFLIYLRNNTPEQLVYKPFIFGLIVVALIMVANALIFLVIDKFIKNLKGLVDGSETELKQNKYCLFGCLGLKALIGIVVYILPPILLPKLHEAMAVKDLKGQINGFIDLYQLNGFYYAAGAANILLIAFTIFVVIKLTKVLQEN